MSDGPDGAASLIGRSLIVFVGGFTAAIRLLLLTFGDCPVESPTGLNLEPNVRAAYEFFGIGGAFVLVL